MQLVQPLSFPIFIFLFFHFSSVSAADPVLLHKQTLASVQHVLPDLSLAADQTMAFAKKNNKHQIISERADMKQVKHTRIQQYYLEFPVFGGYAVIHTPQTSEARVSGLFYRGLDADLGAPPEGFVRQANRILAQFTSSYDAGITSEKTVNPIVYVDEKHHAFWAYKLSVLLHPTDKIPERPVVILDAKTHQVLEQWNDVKTALSTVYAQGYGGNKQQGAYVYGEKYPQLEILRDEASGVCYMENARIRVINMGHRFLTPSYSYIGEISRAKAMSFPCELNLQQSDGSYWTGHNGDGYDSANGAYSPSNDALFFGEVISNLYASWYGLNVLNHKGKPMKMVMRVHYGMAYENAFWDGRQMTFGDGASYFYPLVSLGITAHEISHGFTEQHANLIYRGQSGGMNEAFSDMAAQAAEVYANGRPSWQIGAEIMKHPGKRPALRYMDHPAQDGVSIDNAVEYRQHMDPHHSSGVYNRLFYLLATQSDWDVRKAFQLMIKANMDYWTPYSNFETGGCGMLYAANDLEYATNDVKQALSLVGIDYQNCDAEN